MRCITRTYYRQTKQSNSRAKRHLYFIAQAALEDLRHQLMPLADIHEAEELFGRIDQLNYELFFMIVHVEDVQYHYLK